MELIKIAGDCKGDDCSATYPTDRGTIGVKGTLPTDVDWPDGEAMGEISADLLLRTARAIS